MFSAYVEAMFERRAEDPRYPKAKAINWLSWLARQLQRHDQTEFYLERLPRDWLPTRVQQRTITVASASLVALPIGLFFGLLGGVGPGLRTHV